MIHTGKLKLRLGTSGLSDSDRLQVAVPILEQARPSATCAGFPAQSGQILSGSTPACRCAPAKCASRLGRRQVEDPRRNGA